MTSVTYESVTNDECHLCRVSLMRVSLIRVSLMRVSLMQSVTYAECNLCRVPLILSATHNPFMLSFIMLNVVMLGVVAP